MFDVLINVVWIISKSIKVGLTDCSVYLCIVYQNLQFLTDTSSLFQARNSFFDKLFVLKISLFVFFKL